MDGSSEAIAEAVQRPTMRFVRIKTPQQMDLLALHRVRSRLVSQITGVINQIRSFLIERGIAIAKGARSLPLFLETAENETIEDALDRTGFVEAWNVLQAMQERPGHHRSLTRSRKDPS